MTHRQVLICLVICTVACFTLYYLNEPKLHSFEVQRSLQRPTKNAKYPNTVYKSSSDAEKSEFRSNETIVDKNSLSVDELTKVLLSYCDNSSDPGLDNVSVRLESGTVLPLWKYKRREADEFVKKHAHPGPQKLNPTLRKYKDAERPKPSSLLHKNPKAKIDVKAIDDYVEAERLRRISKGDTDILMVPEVLAELDNDTMPVPNLIHFVWFGCSRFRVDHLITLLAALKFQKPALILYHTDCEPSGAYWDFFKKQAGKTLMLVKRTPPEEIWGIPVKVVEHKADIARLQLMLEVGGIYLDTDSVILRNADELRKHKMLLGESNYNSLANGVIFANRKAWFLRRWYHEYRYFQDKKWGHNSVIVPWALWRIFPDEIHVIKELIFRPNWLELSYIFHDLYDWHQTYVMHLYIRYLKRMDGTKEHTLRELSVLDTTYGQVARHVIWGDEATRDVTGWLVTCNETQGLAL